MDTETVRTSQRLRPLPLSDNDRAQIGHDTTRTSFLQRMPGIPRGHRLYLPLMPLANADVQRVLYIDLSKKVDTLWVISVSAAVSLVGSLLNVSVG